MSSNRRRLPYGWIGLGTAFVALSSFLLASYGKEYLPWLDRRPIRERYRVQEVMRTDLTPVLNAPGRLESAKRTVVRCQLENIAGSVGGSASTLLSLIQEGTVVKQGDVLATLDASNYEEMQRQQVITVEQEKASHLQAKLNVEIALVAVREYHDGIVEETLKGMEGSVALARSDLSRAADHLSWTEKMNGKGYASVASIISEKFSVSQMEFALNRQLWSMDLYQRFTLPKTEKTLQQAVTVAQTALKNEELRLQRQVDRLTALTKQVEYCTIRAPHDGVLYYLKDPDPRSRNPVIIEEGMAVRQRQELFFLPDLSEMEVQMALNESVVNRVRPGMKTKVRFEALPDVELDGEVASVGQFPVPQGRNGEDIRYFMSLVKLDKSPPGLTPGMTTRIDVLLTNRRNVLAIPLASIRTLKRNKVCYVAGDEGLETRTVELGQETTCMVEITSGLQEGELVVLDPPTGSSNVESFGKPGNKRSKPADNQSKKTASSARVVSSEG
jgi:HlyD family secretion protein